VFVNAWKGPGNNIFASVSKNMWRKYVIKSG
jgi:hypothetical protein